MKVLGLKFPVDNIGQLFLSLFVAACCLLSPCPVLYAEEGKWGGVDEAVVEKYAKEHGREVKEPFINTDQGDLLLFVFLLAGTIGGFAAGYYWRVLMVERAPKSNSEKQKTG